MLQTKAIVLRVQDDVKDWDRVSWFSPGLARKKRDIYLLRFIAVTSIKQWKTNKV